MWGRQSESLQSFLSYSRNRDGPRKEDIHLRDCRNTSKSKPSEELPLPKFWCKNPGSLVSLSKFIEASPTTNG